MIIRKTLRIELVRSSMNELDISNIMFNEVRDKSDSVWKINIDIYR